MVKQKVSAMPRAEGGRENYQKRTRPADRGALTVGYCRP